MFRGVFEHAQLGMCVGELDGRLIRVNQAFCRMVGYSEKELLEHVPVEYLDTGLHVAARGPFLVAQQVLPAMRQRGTGSFFFSNNSSSLRGRKRQTGQSLYYPRVLMRALSKITGKPLPGCVPPPTRYMPSTSSKRTSATLRCPSWGRMYLRKAIR